MIRAATLPGSAEERPFLHSRALQRDPAEISVLGRGREPCVDAASLALRLWNEHRDSASLPAWEVVGLEVVERPVHLHATQPRAHRLETRRYLKRRIDSGGPAGSIRCAHDVDVRGPRRSRRPVPRPSGGHELALATRATKDAALQAMADALLADADRDPRRQRRGRRPRPRRPALREHLVDRLRLDAGPGRRRWPTACATSPGCPTRSARCVRGSTLANGLELRQVRVPFGVVGIIYEARPNVTADAAGICLKSGNAVLLRGSLERAALQRRDRRRSLRGAAAAGLPADAVQLVPGEGHEAVKELMRARGLVDVLIPRGGAGLIRSVVEESTVPVIETGVGNCHVYVDAAADLDMALSDRAQRQDPPPVGLQRRRVAAGARRRRRRRSCRGSSRRCRRRG